MNAPVFADDAWIQTYTGKRFWPLAPRAEDVDIRDIAHALSMKCRYGGHCSGFYSVAEHSVHVYRHTRLLAGLLHDAPEAYSPFGDVPRPIKAHVPWVAEIEDRLDRVIAERFGLTLPWPDAVKEADHRIIADEKAALMGVGAHRWPGGYDELLGVHICLWPPFYAEKMFLQAFEEATGGG